MIMIYAHTIAVNLQLDAVILQLLVMIRVSAQKIIVILPLEGAVLSTKIVMIITSALKIPVIPLLDVLTILCLVMTPMLVLKILVILQKDVCTRIYLILACIQKINVLYTAVIGLLAVQAFLCLASRTTVLWMLATLLLDVAMDMLHVMTKMPVQLISVTLIMVARLPL
uniref:Uncharacterized protein n=1 Tax=Arcella intermedia TaxID=1963864 RepID=A0A6B2LIR8_9EUKA